MHPDQLVAGKLYFLCGYHNSKYPVPYIRTCVYVGKNLDQNKEEQTDEYFFDHPQKYFHEGLPKTPQSEIEDYEDSANFENLIVTEKDLHLLNDYSGFIAWVASLKNEPNAERIF